MSIYNLVPAFLISKRQESLRTRLVCILLISHQCCTLNNGNWNKINMFLLQKSFRNRPFHRPRLHFDYVVSQCIVVYPRYTLFFISNAFFISNPEVLAKKIKQLIRNKPVSASLRSTMVQQRLFVLRSFILLTLKKKYFLLRRLNKISFPYTWSSSLNQTFCFIVWFLFAKYK